MEQTEEIKWPPAGLLADAVKLKEATLTSAVEDLDQVMELIENARNAISQGADVHTTGLALTKLQNPIQQGFDKINSDLREVTKAQRTFGKTLDKYVPLRPLPDEADAMASYPDLVNRAILMHLLREGEFQVASTFMQEAKDHPPSISMGDFNDPESQPLASPAPTPQAQAGKANHHEANEADQVNEGMTSNCLLRPSEKGPPPADHQDQDPNRFLHTQILQGQFADMYAILDEVKARNLEPALSWAAKHRRELEDRGSNLEFELMKLKYVWIFLEPRTAGLADDGNGGWRGALQYARACFSDLPRRHRPAVLRLSGAVAFYPNVRASPYASDFDTTTAFSDVAASFAREFCSMLGLSPQSPLFVAVTAGAIALPQLLKYTTFMKSRKAGWSGSNELAFETPLPRSMTYHPLFICPILKVQPSPSNPAMKLVCGHVICKESIKSLDKGTGRFKCPYCPNETLVRETVPVTF